MSRMWARYSNIGFFRFPLLEECLIFKTAAWELEVCNPAPGNPPSPSWHRHPVSLGSCFGHSEFSSVKQFVTSQCAQGPGTSWGGDVCQEVVVV